MVTQQHKMSVNVHKNELMSSRQSVGKWLIFMCFVVRIFWRNWLAINSLLVSVSCGIGGWKWDHFAFMWIVFTFVELYSFMWGRHNCVWEMVFRFTCAVLWKLHG